MMLSPAKLDFPAKFTNWRKLQWKAVDEILAAAKRFSCQMIPTGGGKTAIYIAAAKLFGGRVVIGTATKALQDQIYTDFGQHPGVAIMKGAANYRCNMDPAKMTCEDGRHLKCKDYHTPDCPYRAAYKAFLSAPIACANYSFILAACKFSEPKVGKLDMLILDEAHHALDELTKFAGTTLTDKSIRLLHGLGAAKPPIRAKPQHWQAWAMEVVPLLDQAIDYYSREDQSSREIRYLRALTDAAQQVGVIRSCQPDWIVENKGNSWSFDPLWPRKAAHAHLYADIGRVHLTSATVTEKDLELIGIPRSDTLYTVYPSTFPPERSPFYVMPKYRLDWQTTQGQWKGIFYSMDMFIRQRLDRKGIIHTHSYDRAYMALGMSRQLQQINAVRHGPKQVARAVMDFLHTPPPAALVSPVVTTGYDFPDDQCRYQVILKVPIPDTRSKLLTARCRADKQYRFHITIKGIVQMVGRGTRSAADWCESICFDGMMSALLSKKYRRLWPDFFLRLIRFVDHIPGPLKFH